MKIAAFINRTRVEAEIDPSQRLSDFLRTSQRLTGLKEGCKEGECGACTVLLDGAPVNSCLVLAFQIDGRRVETIEGLRGTNGQPSPLQAAFVAHGGVQCGYCTPGMVMAAEGLLRGNAAPDERAIRHGLAGNLCRCTGYQLIIEAVAAEAARRADDVP